MAEPQQIPFIGSNTQLPTVLGETQLAEVFTTSQNMMTLATNFMDALKTAGYFAPPVINPNFPTVTSAPSIAGATMPALQAVAWVVPAAPAAFSQTPPDVSNYLPGPFTGAAPALSFMALPTKDYGSAPASPPIDLNFTMPTLNLNLPSVPPLMSLDTIAWNGVSTPTLNVSVPQLTAVAPTILPYLESGVYVSALLTSLEADLQHAMDEGVWTGLPGSIETALWDRAREREYRAQADALAELERMESLGYAFPPGVYLDARLKVQTETQNTNVGSSREIMIKQAELTLENVTKSRQIAADLEGKLMDYTNSVAQRAFESSKFVAEAAIQIYNANVEAYKANLEGFRTQASIFETQMRGAQMQVDIFKAELEAEKIKVDMNTALVQQYEAQIRAASLFVEIYKAELGAIETQANLQKIIVEAYSEQIKAYVGQVNAYSAEIEAYKAQIESQGAIENVYKTQVDAYAATVHAGAAEASAVIEGFKAQVSAYTAQLDGYKASVSSMAEQARAASEYNTSTADVFRSEVQGLAAYNEVLTKQWEATMNISEKIAEVAISAAKSNGDLFIASKNIAVEAEKGGAQVAAQLGAAALNAVHFSNASNWSSSVSQSYANSVANSYSGVDSYSQSLTV
jgi:hypothetical protein